jgi:hypothetical protein
MPALRIRFCTITAVIGLFAACAGQAFAAPIISEVTTGTSGDYTLNFSVTNDLNGINSIYFFGVLMDSGNTIVGSPPGLDTHYALWNNAQYGGSSLEYNLNWIDNVTFPIPFGTTQDGFLVHSTDATLPAQVNWFAYGEDGVYTGNDFFNIPSNPGFEGLVSLQAVPEPSTLLLGFFGVLAGAAYFRRTKTWKAHRSRSQPGIVVCE